MAKEKAAGEISAESDKKRLQEEKRKFKDEQKLQKKEARRRAKEIAKEEERIMEDEESNGFVTFIATVFIVCLWLAVICVMIKLDVNALPCNFRTISELASLIP